VIFGEGASDFIRGEDGDDDLFGGAWPATTTTSTPTRSAASSATTAGRTGTRIRELNH
jgi:hypothetical protein